MSPSIIEVLWLQQKQGYLGWGMGVFNFRIITKGMSDVATITTQK